MSDQYEAIVVGSGYGGSVAALRLAAVGIRTLLLERGAERWPGEYPDQILEAGGHLQLNTPFGRWGGRQDLFEFHINPGMSALVGSGLGGTSLINANVVLPASAQWQQHWWPDEIRAHPALWTAAEARARAQLDPQAYPDRFPEVPKLRAMHEAEDHLGDYRVVRPPLAVNFAENPPAVDAGLGRRIQQRPCVGCGDCVSGCNHWAKNTLLMNYLPRAAAAGCTIATGATVRRVRPADAAGTWRIEVAFEDAEGTAFAERALSANVVILAAGSLGSTEILLRSRNDGLSVSDQLGRRFSGNGDHLAFAYNCDQEIRAIGTGSVNDAPPTGPCITAMVDGRRGDGGFLVQEGAVPAAIAWVASEAIRMARYGGTDTDEGDFWQELLRRLNRTDMDHTQVLLAMGEDGNHGAMRLDDNDNIRIDWTAEPRAPHVDEIFTRLTSAWGGTLIKDMTNILTFGFSDGAVTVHPLGGCRMANDAEEGVTNADGQVFADRTGVGVHEGLYVMDGAVVPRSTVVNPFLTIATLAERNIERLIARNATSSASTSDRP